MILPGLIVLWLGLCAWSDLRRRQISNWLTLPVLGLALALGLLQGVAAILRLGLVGLVLGVLWQKGGIGGADVKILLTLAALWPAGLLGALVAIEMAGLVKLIRRQGQVRYPAVPVIAVGVLLAIPFQILIQGGV
jgi:Flp pilus assembly protein protease CpaA